MIVNVRMLAFHGGSETLRSVEIPDHEVNDPKDDQEILDLAFHYGQNEFCQGPNAEILRKSICSVSMGDVIEIERPTREDEYTSASSIEVRPYLILSLGFSLLSQEGYNAYKATPVRSYGFHSQISRIQCQVTQNLSRAAA